MNELIEKLLQPVSADQPCGPDLSYDPRFDELETLLKGKPEIEIGSVQKPAEPPDWREMRVKCAEFLGQSKHLRVAAMLSCSLLQTGGLAGFRDGLQLIRGLVEQYWASLHPNLDPEDNNDPTQRLNILGSLTAGRGSVSGWLKMVDYLYAAPVCQPKGAPPISFDQILAAKNPAPAGEGAPPPGPDLAKLKAAIRDGAADQIVNSRQALQEALEAVQGLDQFLTSTLGAGGTINFENIEKSLKEMLSGLEPFVPGGAAEATAGGAEVLAGNGGTTVGAVGIQVSGSIRSRDDVVRTLDSLCEYYRQVEPSSPVPYLLRRAQKLASMDFVQAMQELNLATVETLKPSMGSAVEAPPPPA